MQYLPLVLCLSLCHYVVGYLGYLAAPTDRPCTIVETGALCGCLIFSRNGRAISTFRGIPYAKPPVGGRRFADPEPAAAWKGVLQATKNAPVCVQKNYLVPNPKVEGDEDCLYLNVYTPHFLTQNTLVKPSLPVMLYIHGGGFFSGTGSSDFHGPEYLLDENIVLVTMNYRLGIMGFLSTNDDAAVGNWGLKDMKLVLEWIRDNIIKFGGDPDNVTIFGQSAGGASVHYLMISPTTKGLFHKAICQSGSALNLWATPINSREIAKAQASFVDCPINRTNKEMVECLKSIPAEELINSGDKFKFWDVDPLTTYLPSVENKTTLNPTPFLPDTPLNLLKKGFLQQIPFMTGVMQNEGIIRAAPIASRTHLRTDLNSKWDMLGPLLLAIGQSVPPDQIKDTWDVVSDFYMGDDDFVSNTDSNNIQSFINLYSDRAFIYGIYQNAKFIVENNPAPVYFYKINYAGKYSWGNVFAASNETFNYKLNSSHCDDLIYLFTIPALFPRLPDKSEEQEMSKVIVKMWTNFATYGKPAKFWEPLEIDNIANSTRFRYLNIAGPNNLKMQDNFLPKRMEFWTNLNILENK